jgi:serine/threonine protein kinase
MYYRPNANQIFLSKTEEHNAITIRGDQYQLTELSEASKTGKGANSAVYLAQPSFSDDLEDFVVKFCRYPIKPLNRSHTRRIKRFKHEVEALKRAQNSPHSNKVVSIIDAGKMTLPSAFQHDKNEYSVAYYVMEKAEDLESYIDANSLADSEKLELFIELSESIASLHSLGIRHRDLKPDNVLIKDGRIKLGDLGLIEDINRDYTIDKPREKIGPFGYMSPEAMNKAFADHSRITDQESIVICERSDHYQLGLILFYLMQGEIPMGCLEDNDFSDCWEPYDEIVQSVKSLLQFRKSRRCSLDSLLGNLHAVV